MKENTYLERHNTFGGSIYANDFDTDKCGYKGNGFNYADRISRDFKFDETCRRKAKQKNIEKRVN